ncbi:hypothetical protein [Bradyrhizobium sp. ORS 86]|uniref:hypothetical protein n=1 Tax=Bradyrhizobium sp. ORS 86 TaxID=1685970 RepID=UPI00388D2A2B
MPCSDHSQLQLADERVRLVRIALLLGALFVGIHASLFYFDLTDPAAFLRGDRAIDRLAHVDGLLAAGSSTIVHAALDSGVPGDFLQHAVLYAIGGRYLVIITQVALQLFTVLLMYSFVARTSGSAKVAAAAGILIVIMPGSLLNPHLLVTEAWFTTLLLIGTVSVCEAVDTPRAAPSPFYLYLGFASLGLASAIRPQGLLIPLVLTPYLLFAFPKARGRSLKAALLAYALFPLSWMTLRFLLVGDFGLGSSNADLATNLAFRADRILSLPLDSTGRMDLLPFIRLAAAHPLAFLNTIYADAFNLILNPGANHLFGYYLQFGETLNGFSWLKVRDQSGLGGVVAELLTRNTTLVALFGIWTAIHAAVLLGVTMAGMEIVRDRHRMPRWIWIVMIVVVTTAFSGFAAGLVRWDLRSGIEPLLAILAAYGLFGRRLIGGPSRPVSLQPDACNFYRDPGRLTPAERSN